MAEVISVEAGQWVLLRVLIQPKARGPLECIKIIKGVVSCATNIGEQCRHGREQFSLHPSRRPASALISGSPKSRHVKHQVTQVT